MALGARRALAHSLGPGIQSDDLGAPQAGFDGVDSLSAAQVENPKFSEGTRREIAGDLHDTTDFNSVHGAGLRDIRSPLRSLPCEELEGFGIERVNMFFRHAEPPDEALDPAHKCKVFPEEVTKGA